LQAAWDEKKNARNLQKQRVSFETATLGFDDPHLLAELDRSFEEERWAPSGIAAPGMILIVAHI